MTIGIYIRVSSEGQEKKEESLPYQKRQGEIFAERMGWEPKLYVDVQTGRDPARKAFVEMKEDIRNGTIQAIWVYNHYRLARNALTALTFVEFLEKQFPIPFYLDNRPYDYNDPRDKQIFTMWAADAEAEASRIRSRTMRGRDHKFSGGGMHVRRLYGWNRNYDTATGKTIYVKNVKEIEVVQEIFNRVIDGESYRMIGRDLYARGIVGPDGGIWKGSVIGRIVTQKLYTGYYDYKDKTDIKSYLYTQIIDDETFAKAQKVATTTAPGRKKGDRTGYVHHIGSSLLRCYNCGGPYTYNNEKQGGYNYHVYKFVHKTGCKHGKAPRVKIEDLDLWLHLQMLDFLSDRESLQNLLESKRQEINKKAESAEENINALEREIQKIKRKKLQLIDMDLDDGDIRNTIKNLSDQSKKLEDEKRELMLLTTDASEEIEAMEKKIMDENVETFLLARPYQQRNMLRERLTEAYIKDGVIVLEWITGRVTKLNNYKSYFETSKEWEKQKNKASQM